LYIHPFRKNETRARKGTALSTGPGPERRSLGQPGKKVFHIYIFIPSVLSSVASRVADPDPGSCAFLIPGPGSGIRNRFITDSGSQTPYFLELNDKFLGKKFYNSLKTGPNLFLQHLKNKIIFNFVKFVATKKGMTTKFFLPLCFVEVFWIRDG
jgi:hypothetical protein